MPTVLQTPRVVLDVLWDIRACEAVSNCKQQKSWQMLLLLLRLLLRITHLKQCQSIFSLMDWLWDNRSEIRAYSMLYKLPRMYERQNYEVQAVFLCKIYQNCPIQRLKILFWNHLQWILIIHCIYWNLVAIQITLLFTILRFASLVLLGN